LLVVKGRKEETIEDRFTNENIKVRSVLLRSSGMVGQAEVHVEVDGNKPLTDVELLLLEIEMEVRSKVSIIEKASIIPHSSSLSKPGTRRWLSGGRIFRGRQQL
jgi:divalent metal cation (Fe/Co/Zn/Cd) transporter